MANAYYNPPAQQQQKKPASLKDLISSPQMIKRFSDVLGSDMMAKSFLSGVLGATNVNAMLSQAQPMSVLSSAMVAATLNLSCVPSLGQAALVPYKTKSGMQCQFQVMTRGLVQLAQRTGQYRNINAGDVYEDEYGGRDILTGDVVIKTVTGGFRDQGAEDKIVGYFAYIETVTGFRKTEFWSIDQVRNHRERFSKSTNGPWSTNFHAMARKTVLKSLLNHYGPMSVESALATAIQDDQKIYKDFDHDGEYLDNPTRDIDAMVFDVSEPEAEPAPAPEPQPQPQAQPAPQPAPEPAYTAAGPEDFFSDDIPGF